MTTVLFDAFNADHLFYTTCRIFRLTRSSVDTIFCVVALGCKEENRNKTPAAFPSQTNAIVAKLDAKFEHLISHPRKQFENKHFSAL